MHLIHLLWWYHCLFHVHLKIVCHHAICVIKI